MPTKSPKPAHHSPEAPEVQCAITKVTGADRVGRPIFGPTYEETCSILKLPGDNTDVSAGIGSSPDRPSASPRRDDAVLLLRITTRIDVDDIIEVAGIRLKAYA